MLSVFFPAVPALLYQKTNQNRGTRRNNKKKITRTTTTTTTTTTDPAWQQNTCNAFAVHGATLRCKTRQKHPRNMTIHAHNTWNVHYLCTEQPWDAKHPKNTISLFAEVTLLASERHWCMQKNTAKVSARNEERHQIQHLPWKVWSLLLWSLRLCCFLFSNLYVVFSLRFLLCHSFFPWRVPLHLFIYCYFLFKNPPLGSLPTKLPFIAINSCNVISKVPGCDNSILNCSCEDPI